MIYHKHLKDGKIIEDYTITLFQIYRQQHDRGLIVISKYADYNAFEALKIKPNSVRYMQNKEGKNMGIFDHDS